MIRDIQGRYSIQRFYHCSKGWNYRLFPLPPLRFLPMGSALGPLGTPRIGPIPLSDKSELEVLGEMGRGGRELCECRVGVEEDNSAFERGTGE
jgi:hypothetical protein